MYRPTQPRAACQPRRHGKVMMNCRLLEGLKAAAPDFEAFVLDQYGVLHDGSRPYPGVLPCLEALRAAGKRVVILSNSGKRKQPNIDRLAAIGIPSVLYDDFVTSGEGTYDFLKGSPEALRRQPAAPGRVKAPLRCLALGGPAEKALLEGLDIVLVSQVEEADFLLLASFGDDAPASDGYQATLAQAHARDLVLVCANPDITGIAGNRFRAAPGQLAARYEKQGGRVIYVGKPHPLIYRSVLGVLAPIPAKRTLAIGDSLAHDIAGAEAVGMASALILQGIHRDDLGEPGKTADFESRLASLMRRYKTSPDFLLRRLAW